MKTQGDIVAAARDLAAKAAGAQELMESVVRLLSAERPYYSWTGFYLMEGSDTLVLGPYQGKPSPHTRIPLNQGICGAAASSGSTLIVDNVNADPRYLACSLETRSEIVVPIKRDGKVLGEIDIDSDRPAAFSDDDRRLLERVANIVAARL
ncbi:MAG TPA: GAF domain-containing protein [Terriglobia bacterium]|nr:GAF domain-containing protein [Terriglobia bacterium]